MSRIVDGRTRSSSSFCCRLARTTSEPSRAEPSLANNVSIAYLFMRQTSMPIYPYGGDRLGTGPRRRKTGNRFPWRWGGSSGLAGKSFPLLASSYDPWILIGEAVRWLSLPATILPVFGFPPPGFSPWPGDICRGQGRKPAIESRRGNGRRLRFSRFSNLT